MARVLIIEDDVFLNKVYAKYLEKAGHVSESLFNGERVVEMASDFEPDIIIVDLIMPEHDGFSAIEDLKANSETKDIPIVVLSVLRTDEDREKVIQMGAAKHLVKSERTFKQVIDEVDHLISR